MRILFSFVGGYGHFEPLVPIARAAEVAGHVVAFTGKPAMVPSVEAAGFTAFATGEHVGSEMSERAPLRRFSAEREDRVLREGFAGWLARNRATGIDACCSDWRPDLLVCDEIDFGAMVVAERLALPCATVLVIATGSFVRGALVAEPLNELRLQHDLPRDPDLAMLHRYLVLSPFPPSFRDPTVPPPATAHPIRPTALAGTVDEAPPPWMASLPDAPTVYLTLGTEFNRESGDLFTRALTALHDLPVNLVVTSGRGIEPDELGRQPANVHIERSIPQALVLPQCRLVVSHGGSGSVIGALAHGLPLLVLPMGGDQALNGARCEQLGVGRMLDAVDSTPGLIRAAVDQMLADPRALRAAEQVRDECLALPEPAHAVTLLEQLATTRCPVLAS